MPLHWICLLSLSFLVLLSDILYLVKQWNGILHLRCFPVSLGKLCWSGRLWSGPTWGICIPSGQCRAGTVGVVPGVPEAASAPHSHADSTGEPAARLAPLALPSRGCPGRSAKPGPSLRARGGQIPAAPPPGTAPLPSQPAPGRAGYCAFREPGGRGKWALPPQPAAPPQVPLSVFLCVRPLRWAALAALPLRVPPVPRFRGWGVAAVQPLWPGISRRVPPAGLAECGASASEFAVSALALCASTAANHGERQLPAAPPPPAAVLYPRAGPTGTGPCSGFTNAPIGVTRRSVWRCSCPSPSGTLGSGFRLCLLIAFSECCATSIVYPQVFSCLFPQKASLGFLCTCSSCQWAGSPGAAQHGGGDWFGLATILVEDSQEGS